MKVLYSTKCTATGGRDGHAESDDGNLSVDLSMPKKLGGMGSAGATNPEQLFAAGYAACFESAIRHVARLKKYQVPGLTVECEVGLVPVESGFGLVVSLHPVFTGIEDDKRKELVTAAHKACPYSNAIKGNIEVKFTINAVAFVPKM